MVSQPWLLSASVFWRLRYKALTTAPAVLYFTPYGDKTLQVGEVTQVDININAHIAVNALGITIKFPQDILEVVGFSKEKSFLDLWTEDTAIKEDTGEVHFSGGTTQKGGLIGTSTTLTLSIRAKKPGMAILSFEDPQVYASDGNGTLLPSRSRSVTFTISEPVAIPLDNTISAVSAGGGTTMSPQKALVPPSSDLNGDGKVDLIDMSIMVIHIIGSYDSRYDLNLDGTVGISDLSILISQMGQVK